MRYILVAQPDDHKALYDYFWAGEGEDIVDMTITSRHLMNQYRFMHNVPLNDSHPDLKVTVVYNIETNTKTGTTVKRMWVTDLTVTERNVATIVKGARARWKIENETFNCLKTKGYAVLKFFSQAVTLVKQQLQSQRSFRIYDHVEHKTNGVSEYFSANLCR